MHRRRMDLASACRTGSTTGEGVHTKLGTFLEERYDDPRSDRAIILYIDIETFGGGWVEPLWRRRDSHPGHASHFVRVYTPYPPSGLARAAWWGRRWASGERSDLTTW
jgi:hypothetical protein